MPVCVEWWAALMLCRSDTDECKTSQHNCDAHADCLDTVSSFVCKCKNGYSGTGTEGNCRGKLPACLGRLRMDHGTLQDCDTKLCQVFFFIDSHLSSLSLSLTATFLQFFEGKFLHTLSARWNWLKCSVTHRIANALAQSNVRLWSADDTWRG